jgi:hypothetical protein
MKKLEIPGSVFEGEAWVACAGDSTKGNCVALIFQKDGKVTYATKEVYVNSEDSPGRLVSMDERGNQKWEFLGSEMDRAFQLSGEYGKHNSKDPFAGFIPFQFDIPYFKVNTSPGDGMTYKRTYKISGNVMTVTVKEFDGATPMDDDYITVFYKTSGLVFLGGEE